MVGRRRERAVAASVSIATPPGRTRVVRRALAAALAGRLGRPVELTEDQGRAMDAVRADVAGRIRCCGSSRATSGRARRRSPRTHWRWRPARAAGRPARSDRPAGAPARRDARDFLRRSGSRVELLTGSLAGPASRRRPEARADGRAQSSSGRTRCSRSRVAYARLGLAVVDEQHRFGVAQRGALEAKTRGGAPHVLLDDSDADPADARSGALCRPRRLRPAHGADRPPADPDRDAPSGRARPAVDVVARRRRRAGDVRGCAPHRRGGAAAVDAPDDGPRRRRRRRACARS